MQVSESDTISDNRLLIFFSFNQYDIQDRRKVYSILEKEDIEIPRYAVLDRESRKKISMLLHQEVHIKPCDKKII